MPRLSVLSADQFVRAPNETDAEFDKRGQEWMQSFHASVFREIRFIFGLINGKKVPVQKYEFLTSGTTWTPPAGVYAVLVSRLQAAGAAQKAADLILKREFEAA